ncbi:MAG: hypothetical protein ACRC26_04770 [Bacteroidales bacterium]
MALNNESVKKAVSILKKINPGASVVKHKVYERYNRKTSYAETDKIYCLDEKSDCGYENVFMNIENISDQQRELFEEMKKEVPNSSFMRAIKECDCASWEEWKVKKHQDITTLGWF